MIALIFCWWLIDIIKFFFAIFFAVYINIMFGLKDIISTSNYSPVKKQNIAFFWRTFILFIKSIPHYFYIRLYGLKHWIYKPYISINMAICFFIIKDTIDLFIIVFSILWCSVHRGSIRVDFCDYLFQLDRLRLVYDFKRLLRGLFMVLGDMFVGCKYLGLHFRLYYPNLHRRPSLRGHHQLGILMNSYLPVCIH